MLYHAKVTSSVLSIQVSRCVIAIIIAKASNVRCINSHLGAFSKITGSCFRQISQIPSFTVNAAANMANTNILTLQWLAVITIGSHQYR